VRACSNLPCVACMWCVVISSCVPKSHFGCRSWVLYTSGPDNMLTPTGALALSDWILTREHSLRPSTSYLGSRFPAARAQLRFSMDAFVFWTETWRPASDVSVHSPWLNATRWCLHGFGPADISPGIKPTHADPRADHPIPEMLLNEVRWRFNLTFRLFPGGHGHAISRARLKVAATGPKTHPSGELHSFWHSHNTTAIQEWTKKYGTASFVHLK
jgi:hypothetical protein